MKESKNALNYVQKLIEDLNNELSLKINVVDIRYEPFTYFVSVSVNNKTHRIEFERSVIDDLEVALEKYKHSRYFDTLESSIKFRIYVDLGKEGLLKGFDVSRKLISDRRDWIKDYKVNTSFSPEMTELLYEGLKKLLNFFNSQIEKHKSLNLDYSEIEENKHWAQGLIDYYDTHNHLNSTGVGTKNLQFLKAAAIKQIIDLEETRRSERTPTTLKALDKKIYDIVIELRKDPFLEIELPNFMCDIGANYETNGKKVVH